MYLSVLMISAFMNDYLPEISCRDCCNSVMCLESTGENEIQEVNFP